MPRPKQRECTRTLNWSTQWQKAGCTFESLKVILLRYGCIGIMNLVLWDRSQVLESRTLKTYFLGGHLKFLSQKQLPVLNPCRSVHCHSLLHLRAGCHQNQQLLISCLNICGVDANLDIFESPLSKILTSTRIASSYCSSHEEDKRLEVVPACLLRRTVVTLCIGSYMLVTALGRRAREGQLGFTNAVIKLCDSLCVSVDSTRHCIQSTHLLVHGKYISFVRFTSECENGESHRPETGRDIDGLQTVFPKQN